LPFVHVLETMQARLTPAVHSALFELVFEHAMDPTVVFDEDGQVLALNRAARDLSEEIVDRLFAGDAPSPPELAAFHADLEEYGSARAEIRMMSRAFLLVGQRHHRQIVVVVRDETRAHRLEADLRALQRVESLGQFTASLVHDFNNLLTPIACVSAILEAELAHDERNGPLAREVRDAADRATNLARQMMSLVRREPPSMAATDVNEVLAGMRPLLERVVSSGVTVQLRLGDDVEATLIDRERLEHVILNLAANARDAMPGGGTLTVATRTVAFDPDEADAVEGAHAGAYVLIRVTDTGVGMTREVRERVFERFFTTKQIGHGTGLGLASVRRFVGESGGCVSVHSGEGHGTTVSLYLPVFGRRRAGDAGG
jgi:signal transduction histidine kinase